MTIDETISYLESEATKAEELAASLSRWQKNPATVRERAVKMRGAVEAIKGQRVLLAMALMPHPRERRGAMLENVRYNSIDSLPGKIG